MCMYILYTFKFCRTINEEDTFCYHLVENEWCWKKTLDFILSVPTVAKVYYSMYSSGKQYDVPRILHCRFTKQYFHDDTHVSCSVIGNAKYNFPEYNMIDMMIYTITIYRTTYFLTGCCHFLFCIIWLKHTGIYSGIFRCFCILLLTENFIRSSSMITSLCRFKNVI